MVEINGVNYTEAQINAALKKYSSYLEGIIGGQYTATQGEVELLRLTGNQNSYDLNSQNRSTLESIIAKLNDFSTSRDNISTYDFNSSNTRNEDDLDLLKHIIDNRESQSALQIYDQGETVPDWVSRIANHLSTEQSIRTQDAAFFKTTGGYTVVTTVGRNSRRDQYLAIYGADDKFLGQINSNTVNEINPTANGNAAWGEYFNLTDDSTLVLPDGTKLALNMVPHNYNTMGPSRPNPSKVLKGLTIQSGNNIASVGLDSTDSRNSITSQARMLDQNSSNWDIANADSIDKGGVFVLSEITNQWAKLNNNSFADVVGTKLGETPEVNPEAGSRMLANRAQLIASLDGEQINEFNSIKNSSIREDLKLELENSFLTRRVIPSAFTQFQADLTKIQGLNIPSDLKAKLMERASSLATINDTQNEFLSLIETYPFKVTSNDDDNNEIKRRVIAQVFEIPNTPARTLSSTQEAFANSIASLLGFKPESDSAYKSTYNTIIKILLSGQNVLADSNSTSIEPSPESSSTTTQQPTSNLSIPRYGISNQSQALSANLQNANGTYSFSRTYSLQRNSSQSSSREFILALNDFLETSSINPENIASRVNLFIGSNALQSNEEFNSNREKQNDKTVLNIFYATEKNNLQSRRALISNQLSTSSTSRPRAELQAELISINSRLIYIDQLTTLTNSSL